MFKKTTTENNLLELDHVLIAFNYNYCPHMNRKHFYNCFALRSSFLKCGYTDVLLTRAAVSIRTNINYKTLIRFIYFSFLIDQICLLWWFWNFVFSVCNKIKNIFSQISDFQTIEFCFLFTFSKELANGETEDTLWQTENDLLCSSTKQGHIQINAYGSES